MQGPIDGPVEQSSREGLYRDRKESMGAQMAETKQLASEEQEDRTEGRTEAESGQRTLA